jgi:hypothetical protein
MQRPANLAVLSAVLAAAVLLASPVGAQVPFMPRPDLGKHAQCTKDYVKSVETYISGLQKLRTAGPAFVGQVCSVIETGSDWLGGELSDTTRQKLKGLLGVDIDLRFIKTQCRVGQGNLERELMTELGFLKSELVRCNDTI